MSNEFRKVYQATPCPYIILISPDKQKVFEVAEKSATATTSFSRPRKSIK